MCWTHSQRRLNRHSLLCTALRLLASGNFLLFLAVISIIINAAQCSFNIDIYTYVTYVYINSHRIEETDIISGIVNQPGSSLKCEFAELLFHIKTYIQLFNSNISFSIFSVKSVRWFRYDNDVQSLFCFVLLSLHLLLVVCSRSGLFFPIRYYLLSVIRMCSRIELIAKDCRRRFF